MAKFTISVAAKGDLISRKEHQGVSNLYGLGRHSALILMHAGTAFTLKARRQLRQVPKSVPNPQTDQLQNFSETY